MEIVCENLGGSEILVDAIKELAQIYRFDEFRITLKGNGSFAQFDIPSTEWLEHFTEVLKSNHAQEFERTLRGSGWWFHVLRTDTEISLFVFDLGHGRRVKIDLTLPEARRLHHAVLETILLPFAEQGGVIEELTDLEQFRFPDRQS